MAVAAFLISLLNFSFGVLLKTTGVPKQVSPVKIITNGALLSSYLKLGSSLGTHSAQANLHVKVMIGLGEVHKNYGSRFQQSMLQVLRRRCRCRIVHDVERDATAALNAAPPTRRRQHVPQ